MNRRPGFAHSARVLNDPFDENRVNRRDPAEVARLGRVIDADPRIAVVNEALKTRPKPGETRLKPG